MSSFGNESPVAINALKALGITATAGLGGLMLGCTVYAIPTLLIAPASVAVTQWNNMFDRGKALNPPVVAVLASAFAFLSYRAYGNDRPTWTQYAGAAVLLPSVIPFTLLVMNPTNNELIARAGREVATDSTRALLQKWGVLNACRSLFLFTSAGLGLWATLTEG